MASTVHAALVSSGASLSVGESNCRETTARPTSKPLLRLPQSQQSTRHARRGRACTIVATGGVMNPGVQTWPGTAEEKKASPQTGGLQKLFDDYAVGYRSLTTDCETEGWIVDVVGQIPPELTGTLLRNGPALFERQGRKKVFLDGDGMISSIAIKDGKAYFRNKFVRTPGFIEEEEDDAFKFLSIFTEEDPRPQHSGKPTWQHRLMDDIFAGPPSLKNNAAYNAWYWGDSLVAVDFGKPHGLSKTNMDTIGPVDEFSSDKYTAHSRILAEPDTGELRLITFSPYVDWAQQKTTVTFAEWNEVGKKVKESVFEFRAAYFHDLVVTDNWYILFDCPIKMDILKTFVGYPMGKHSLGDTISADHSRPPLFRMFPRREGLKPMEVPVNGMHCYAYHHVNGFDIDGGDKVIFDTCTWDRFNLYFKDIVEPDGKDFYPRTKLSRFLIDLKAGVATHSVMNERPCEYPTVAPSASGRPYRHSYMSTSAISEGNVNGPMQALTKVSMRDPSSTTPSTTESTWYPGKRRFVGEPLFVARPGSDGSVEDDGWLLVLVHDSEAEGTEVAIMDAQAVEDGPLALLKLPTYVPMGVHGSWTDSYILGPQVN